jgi:hypothetical protein
MEIVPVDGAPASSGSNSSDRGPPPEEDERNNETQRSDASVDRAASLGGGGAGSGMPRNVLKLLHRRIACVQLTKPVAALHCKVLEYSIAICCQVPFEKRTPVFGRTLGLLGFRVFCKIQVLYADPGAHNILHNSKGCAPRVLHSCRSEWNAGLLHFFPGTLNLDLREDTTAVDAVASAMKHSDSRRGMVVV